MFHELIAQCAANFGAAPRTFSIWDRLTYWRVVRPDWLYQNHTDELETLFLNLRKLRRNGRVVWGHFIHANSTLHARGGNDALAEVIYSLDEADPIRPEDLGAVAGAVAALKHTKPADPELAVIADHLTDEYTRAYGRPVPRSIAPRQACQMSTIYIVRKHLPKPGQYLRRPLLPIIVNPAAPHVTLALPSRYWPEALVKWWAGGS